MAFRGRVLAMWLPALVAAAAMAVAMAAAGASDECPSGTQGRCASASGEPTASPVQGGVATVVEEEGAEGDELAALQLRGETDPQAASRGFFCRRRRSSPAEDLPLMAFTDMSFEDWGAFSIWKAAGITPEAVLMVDGFQDPSNFAEKMGNILWSWDMKVTCYSAQDGCHHSCNLPRTWADMLKMQAELYQPYAMNGEMQDVVMHPVAGFPWCDGKKYRLVVMGPMSELDYSLWVDEKRAECIHEVIATGVFFGATPEGRTVGSNDVTTWNQLNPLSAGNFENLNETSLVAQFQGTLPGGADMSTYRHTDAISDALATARGFQKLAELGVKVTIIPAEVGSWSRYGKQVIQRDNLEYNQKQQNDLTYSAIRDRLCRGGMNESGGETPGNPDAKMLQRMACLHIYTVKMFNFDGQYTLDGEAIAATYLWAPDLFTFDSKFHLFAADPVNGLTYTDCREIVPGVCACQETTELLKCAAVRIATDFDAITWFDRLEKELLQYP